MIDWPKPVHWYIKPRSGVPSPFCVEHPLDADAAEWHEKEHGHEVVPLYSKAALEEAFKLGVASVTHDDEVIEIDEAGNVSKRIRGPIREGP